ncbi:MAG: hypothetical protein JWM41_488 [Gemmatimonadetes bacterium]|nr:hypothetical protein [Gemmatimonadota bacterium]
MSPTVQKFNSGSYIRARANRAGIILVGLASLLVAGSVPAGAQGSAATANYNPTVSIVTDVAKGLGSCAAEKPEGCLTFGFQLLTGKVGAETDAQKTLDKLDSVNTRLDGIQTSISNLQTVFEAGISRLSDEINTGFLGNKRGTMSVQVAAINTYLTDFKLAARRCLNNRRSAPQVRNSACAADSTTLTADLKVVFDHRTMLYEQLMGNGIPEDGYLRRLWRHNAFRPFVGGPDLKASMQAAYNYWAGIERTQLALVAQYENIAAGNDPSRDDAKDPRRADAIPEVKAEVDMLNAQLTFQATQVPGDLPANSFLDLSVPNAPTIWTLMDKSNFRDADMLVTKAGGQLVGWRIAGVPDLTKAVAGADPTGAYSAGYYISQLLMGSGGSNTGNTASKALWAYSTQFDSLWTSTQPYFGNADGNYELGCELIQDGHYYDCWQKIVMHKEDVQRIVANLGAGPDGRFSTVSWAMTLNCQPPHFNATTPLFIIWDPKHPGPCSWWKYKGSTVDANIAVYVTPHVHPWFLIKPFDNGSKTLPPS